MCIILDPCIDGTGDVKTVVIPVTSEKTTIVSYVETPDCPFKPGQVVQLVGSTSGHVYKVTKKDPIELGMLVDTDSPVLVVATVFGTHTIMCENQLEPSSRSWEDEVAIAASSTIEAELCLTEHLPEHKQEAALIQMFCVYGRKELNDFQQALVNDIKKRLDIIRKKK